MPFFTVQFYRARPETAIMTVEADCADDICIEEDDIEPSEWYVDQDTTYDYEQVSVEEDK